jgi:hypothetical protein
MNISGVAMNDSLAAQATHMHSAQLGLRLATTVLKSVMDSQKQQGLAIVEMIRQTPSAAGIGSRIDARA